MASIYRSLPNIATLQTRLMILSVSQSRHFFTNGAFIREPGSDVPFPNERKEGILWHTPVHQISNIII